MVSGAGFCLAPQTQKRTLIVGITGDGYVPVVEDAVTDGMDVLAGVRSLIGLPCVVLDPGVRTPGGPRAQAQELADQFDSNMFPKESQAFSVAPDRDGSGNQIEDIDATGDGDKIMTLVDNVRDDNYYEFPANPTYIAGFFSSQINELLDRNVMTIDAFECCGSQPNSVRALVTSKYSDSL